MDWDALSKIRGTVEKYYRAQSERNNIDIPKYDLFVTEVRKDWERAGFDLTTEADLYRLWGALAVTCAAMGHMLGECKTKDELTGALRLASSYSNMIGLFLREVTKDVPGIPAAVVPVKDADES